MSPAGLSDAPFEEPSDDLLGFARFPHKLAELIRADPGALTVDIWVVGVGQDQFRPDGKV